MNKGLSHEQACKLRYLVNKGHNINVISSRLGLDKDLITRFLFDAEYDIVDDNVVRKHTIDLETKKCIFSKDMVNILVLADTHLGHTYDRVDLLKKIYQEASERETDVIFHLGDLTNGINKETKIRSLESLKNYCIRYYPYSEVDTYILSGNHDNNNKNNINIVQEITNVRNDLTYLGNKPIIINVNDTKFLLAHGDDKNKYRKLIKETNINILMYGHEHRSGLISNKKYVELRVPSLLDDGKKDMGVWWLTMYDNNQIDYELESFPKRVLKK